jgi:GNAT superfamily N-acetyltransferase
VESTLTLPRLELARRTERNFINSFQGFQGINNSVFAETDTVAKFRTGYPVAWMNCVLRINGNADNLNGEVAVILRDYEQLSCPMYWFVGALTNRASRVKEVLEARGLQFSGNYVGMALEPKMLSSSPPLPELRIEEVDGSRKIRHWLQPFTVCFAAPEIVKKHFQEYGCKRLGDSSKEVWLVGYCEDLPVSTAAYVINSGVIMLHSVTTLPQFRRRGYARRIMETAINHALKRVRLPICLYSSPMGMQLYKNMGFVEVYEFAHYLFQP